MEESRYFDFLCAIVGRSHEYSILLDELHGIEFYSLIPNDDNRCEDGKHLRQLFIDEVGPTGSSSLPHNHCTVLEMLIGLSFRLEFETAQSRWEKKPSEWFWILIDNLGISEWDNECFDEHRDEWSVLDEQVGRMLARDYEANGNGGLFPLKETKRDQRRVEIWYQMSEYIMENYPM